MDNFSNANSYFIFTSLNPPISLDPTVATRIVVHALYVLIGAQLSVVHKYLFALALRIVNTTYYRAMMLVAIQMY